MRWRDARFWLTSAAFASFKAQPRYSAVEGLGSSRTSAFRAGHPTTVAAVLSGLLGILSVYPAASRPLSPPVGTA
jgi:hypothetical protein